MVMIQRQRKVPLTKTTTPQEIVYRTVADPTYLFLAIEATTPCAYIWKLISSQRRSPRQNDFNLAAA